MAIKRYTANADNTIVNAYQSDMATRGTGSNAGYADVMEVFSIYGRESSGSQELSRILVKFPIADVITDRAAGTVPASGSVSFYLRLFNAQHSKTVPEDYKLVVAAVSDSWQEGVGLDLETYKDDTKGNTGSNWINANNNFTSASATVAALSKTAGQANTRVLTIADSSANSVNFSIDNSLTTSTATKIAFGNANSNATQFATNIAAAVNLANTAGTLNVTAVASDATVTLTQTAKGLAGNSADDIAGTAVTDSVVTVSSQFSGGDGQWASVGGDYLNTADYLYTQDFSDGLEDVEVNITPLVERWIAGDQTNYGVGVRLSASYEAYATAADTSADSSVVTNTDGATKSYYTKRFFARGSQYFFKRPVIEARWKSATHDDRGNFYYSSSLAPAADNLNTIYLYNYVRGVLQNIPSIASGKPIYVSVFSGSSDDSAPSGSALQLTVDNDGHVGSNNRYVVTGGIVSTGIYSASFAFTGSTSLETIYDVWFTGSHNHASASHAGVTQYFTSSISPITHYAAQTVSKPVYYMNITNNRGKYRNNETARFNLFIREKYWNPTIYTVANSSPPTVTIESASYRVYRTIDAYEAIPYGTGSDLSTLMSYDVSGNYFDLDMNVLEPGYEYAIKFALYESPLSSWSEQPESFTFRVEDYEY